MDVDEIKFPQRQNEVLQNVLVDGGPPFIDMAYVGVRCTEGHPLSFVASCSDQPVEAT